MTEEEFRKSICEKYADHFKHFYTLFKFAEEAAVNYRNFTTTSQEASVTLIFGRALKSFDSIRRLCEVALCEDAAVVLSLTGSFHLGYLCINGRAEVLQACSRGPEAAVRAEYAGL